MPSPQLLQRIQESIAAGRWEEARALLEPLAAQPGAPPGAFYQLCEADILAGDPARALERLRSVDLAADLEAAFLHARAQAAAGRLQEARDELRALLGRLPQDSAVARMHLAAVEERLGDREAAMESLAVAARLAPADVDVCLRLARLQATLARPQQALRSVHEALARAPSTAAQWRDIAQLFAEHFEWQQAQHAIERATTLDPGEPRAEALAAVTHQELGDMGAAMRALERAAVRAPHDLHIAVARRLMLPQVYEDIDDLAAWRKRYEEGLAQLVRELPRWMPHARDVFDLNRSNFLLAYQGGDDREPQRAYSSFVGALAGEAWPQGREPIARRFDGSRRLRVGFASSFFRDCTIGRYFERWITGLDPRRFERFVYHAGPLSDDFTRRIAGASEHFALLREGSLAAARRLRSDALDVLVHPEVGMDPFGYVLAALRLAPVQLAAWGHPVTTGSGQIDFYLTVDAMEPPDGDAHYVERLLRLPGPGVDYAMPPPAPLMARGDFGLPENGRIYACPQSLFKVHPGMDAVFAGILAADPQAVLVFFEAVGRAATERFAARVRRALAALGVPEGARLRFMPRMGGAQFRALLALADVVVDTMHWSGGNTSLDAFAAGTPVVTLPGRYMRGRQTAAMLSMMGLPELVVDSPQGLAAAAVGAARDRERNAWLRERVAAGRGALFDRREPVAALQEMLLRAGAGDP